MHGTDSIKPLHEELRLLKVIAGYPHINSSTFSALIGSMGLSRMFALHAGSLGWVNRIA
jgi:hypothetical protein